MIKTTTYMGRDDKLRDLLAAFSSVDRSLSTLMTPADLRQMVARLLTRLATICVVHGHHVPQQFLRNLSDASSQDSFDVVCNYLECGTQITSHLGRELQQELVHFSRIVDLGFFQSGPTKRLRHSERIPDSLKILIELVTVARARVLQRFPGVDLPRRRRRQVVEDETEHRTIIRDDEIHDYALAISYGRRRDRRYIGFLFAELLQYLTPIEAVFALAASTFETTIVSTDIEIELLYTAAGAIVRGTATLPASISILDDPFALAERLLPKMEVIRERSVTVESVQFRSGPRIKLIPLSENRRPDASAVVSSACQQWEMAATEFASIEFAHLHLDRDIDFDQEVGAQIGVALVKRATATGGRPLLVLMIDDDHVLVKTRPYQYRTFIDNFVAEYDLVPESSPIVRSLVVALYHRLLASPLAKRLEKRGGNVYLKLSDDSVVELFEDWAGECITGCVFFECALLLYRTLPAEAQAAFRRHVADDPDPHKRILATLDSPLDHDSLVVRLNASVTTNGPLLDPRICESSLSSDLRRLFNTLDPVVHVNVLEDYYEIQQAKVRQLLSDLGLPIMLVTLYFNTHTGAVRLAGPHNSLNTQCVF